MATSVLVIDKFYSGAQALRSVFEQRFADPRIAHQQRFVWDYWHIPDQYTALRTPAWTYFPTKIYERWHQALVQWGRENLGCHDVSPPWLSNYITGCKQELHGDLPHGPFAFVFSLTPQPFSFQGGETMLLRNEILDYWHGFESVRSLELSNVVRFIAPRFNRLTVFDPRIPHGVREVTGQSDPRFGRLVIHGWFVQPRPFVRGALASEQGGVAVAEQIDALTPLVVTAIGSTEVSGMVSLAIDIAPAGEVRSVNVLVDTLQAVTSQRQSVRAIVRKLASHCKQMRFPRRRSASKLTLPLVFER